MDEIKSKAQKIIDVWNSKNLELITELYKNDVVFFDPLLGVEIKGDNILLYAKGIYDIS